MAAVRVLPVKRAPLPQSPVVALAKAVMAVPHAVEQKDVCRVATKCKWGLDFGS